VALPKGVPAETQLCRGRNYNGNACSKKGVRYVFPSEQHLTPEQTQFYLHRFGSISASVCFHPVLVGSHWHAPTAALSSCAVSAVCFHGGWFLPFSVLLGCHCHAPTAALPSCAVSALSSAMTATPLQCKTGAIT